MEKLEEKQAQQVGKETSKMEESCRKKEKSFFLFFGKKIFFLNFLGLFFLIVLPFSLCLFDSSRRIFSVFLKRLPYPVAWVQGAGLINSRELLSDLEAVKIFYRSEDFAEKGLRVDFSTQEGRERLRLKEKDILDKLVEDKIIEALAKERGISVSVDEAERDILEKVKTAGDSKTFALNLKKNYDWSINTFRDKVVIPQLYLKKLIAWFQNNDEKARKSKELIEEVLKEVSSDGKNFSELAKKYSEGESASSGGELGWFRREDLVDEVGEKVFSMKVGEISGVIESPLGWHLVLLEEEKQDDGANSEKIKEVKIKQIFLGKGNFLEWLTKEKNRFGVWIFIRDYYWDKEAGSVIFRDSSMRSKETDLRMKADGDPSL